MHSALDFPHIRYVFHLHLPRRILVMQMYKFCGCTLERLGLRGERLCSCSPSSSPPHRTHIHKRHNFPMWKRTKATFLPSVVRRLNEQRSGRGLTEWEQLKRRRRRRRRRQRPRRRGCVGSSALYSADTRRQTDGWSLPTCRQTNKLPKAHLPAYFCQNRN